jgi:hypothetical protein
MAAITITGAYVCTNKTEYDSLVAWFGARGITPLAPSPLQSLVLDPKKLLPSSPPGAEPWPTS